MRNLVKDIERNCPECRCSVEETIKYLYNHEDIVSTAEAYREVYNFYLECLDMFEGEPYAKKKARELTIENYKISHQTFKNIQKRVSNR